MNLKRVSPRSSSNPPPNQSTLNFSPKMLLRTRLLVISSKTNGLRKFSLIWWRNPCFPLDFTMKSSLTRSVYGSTKTQHLSLR